MDDILDDFVDITPTPQVLRILGMIPFDPWQCIAELIDNSIDALSRETSGAAGEAKKRVIVSWSSETVAPSSRTLEVVDTGPGMTLRTIRDSVRAGYTSNDPLNNLGLFGMGFNIATARLGDKTEFLSATEESDEWVGITIDFPELIKSGVFKAPKVSYPKTKPGGHGTKIVISQLKPNMYGELTKSPSEIRRVLSEVYAPILRNHDIEIMIQGVRLSGVQPCLWDAKRYVSLKGGETIPAVLEVDEIVGDAPFDAERHRYLTPAEEDDLRVSLARGEALPPGIVQRTKRIHGWLGIQRYADPNDFGIDFIRNGRKIVRRDKTLFTFYNPLTGNPELEYPLELGSTVGGRIIGEIHVDHVPPNYMKSDFERTDPTWYEVVEMLRGSGPIRPSKRKLLEYRDSNTAPLARLVRGYEQIDAGTRHLFAPSSVAKVYAEKFRKGDPDYLTDEKWWEAALEEDRNKADKGAQKAPAVDAGTRSSDEASAYVTQSSGSSTATSPSNGSTSAPQQAGASSTANAAPVGATNGTGIGASVSSTATRGMDQSADYKGRSRRISIDSLEYTYPGCRAPFSVTVWELTTGKIGDGEDGEPAILIKDGNQCDFFFNPGHPFLRDYPLTYRDLLLLALADRFKVRDNLSDIVPLFVGMWTEHFPDQRIDQARIQEKAAAFFGRLRERAAELLSLREQEVLDCIHESLGEVEEIVSALISSPDLLRKFQSRQVGAINALSQVPARTLVRLVERFPEEFFDGKCFNVPYLGIELSDEKSTERLRNEAKDRLLSFLKDALWVISEVPTTSRRQRKAELARCSYSLAFLEQEARL